MTAEQMIAYHGDPAIKGRYLTRVRMHRTADEIVQGYGYWKGRKGCAVGCTLHSYEHMAYESELGIPVMLARLEDRIFEGLPPERSKVWPEQFLAAAPVGADLSRVGWKFQHWLLTQELKGRGHPLVRDAVKRCADVLVPLTKGEPVDASAAASAAESAASAAWSAASAEESAAESAAWSAASAAWSAASAAESAAEIAAWSAARSAAYVRMADKLLLLMAECGP